MWPEITLFRNQSESLSLRAGRTAQNGGALPSLGKLVNGGYLVPKDPATLLKGKGLTLLLWLRQDSAPAHGESSN